MFAKYPGNISQSPGFTRNILEMIKKVLKEMLNKANRRVINLEGISKPWAQCYQTEQYSF